MKTYNKRDRKAKDERNKTPEKPLVDRKP